MRWLRAVACGPGRRSTLVMLGHACETWAMMYLQRGPPTAENKPTTHRTHRTHRTRYAWWQLPAAVWLNRLALFVEYTVTVNFDQDSALSCCAVLLGLCGCLQNENHSLHSATPRVTREWLSYCLLLKKHASFINFICKNQNYTTKSSGMEQFFLRSVIKPTVPACLHRRQTSADSSCNIWTQNTYKKDVQIHRSHSEDRLASLHGGLLGWLTLHLSSPIQRLEKETYTYDTSFQLCWLNERETWVWHQHKWDRALNRRNHKFKRHSNKLIQGYVNMNTLITLETC
jgi:hypothetical protein